MAASVGWEEEEEDEWEAFDDNGFVYKRKKRRRSYPPTTSYPSPDKTHLKNRRKYTLLKLKERYKKEISQWDHLSNTFNALTEKTDSVERNGNLFGEGSSTSVVEINSEVGFADSAFRRRIDELAIRVEADRAIIQGISDLCDTAEAICNAQEQHLKKEYLDFPIWVSPREIMAVLCDTHSQTENGVGSG